MKKYIVKIKLSNGNEVQTRVEAADQGEALDRVEDVFRKNGYGIPHFDEIVAGATPTGVEVNELPEQDDIPDSQKYPRQSKKTLEEYKDIRTFMMGSRCVAVDTSTGLGFTFVPGKFEQTAEQHIEPKMYKRNLEPWEVAASSRRVGDYLREIRLDLYSRNKNPYKYEIAKAFKDRREELGMSIEELAVRSGVFVDTLEKMEKGNILMTKLSTIETVAEVLGCHIRLVPDNQK